MKDITSELLIKLGFIENYVTPKESGQKDGYTYYSYEIDDQCILYSDCDDENDGNFTITFYHFEDLKTSNYTDLFNLVSTINKFNTKNG